MILPHLNKRELLPLAPLFSFVFGTATNQDVETLHQNVHNLHADIANAAGERASLSKLFHLSIILHLRDSIACYEKSHFTELNI